MTWGYRGFVPENYTLHGKVKRICICCHKDEISPQAKRWKKVCATCWDYLPKQTCGGCGETFKSPYKLGECYQCSEKRRKGYDKASA